MVNAFQKDTQGIIKRFAKDPSKRNYCALFILIKSVSTKINNNALSLIASGNIKKDQSSIESLMQLLKGFTKKSKTEKQQEISAIDAQSIYRQALLDFDIDPEETQYFKNKKTINNE